jgi:hypothetical protein
VRLIYVDNSHVVAPLLEELFPGMEVKEDLYHVFARVDDVLHDAHPAKRKLRSSRSGTRTTWRAACL